MLVRTLNRSGFSRKLPWSGTMWSSYMKCDIDCLGVFICFSPTTFEFANRENGMACAHRRQRRDLEENKTTEREKKNLSRCFFCWQVVRLLKLWNDAKRSSISKQDGQKKKNPLLSLQQKQDSVTKGGVRNKHQQAEKSSPKPRVYSR